MCILKRHHDADEPWYSKGALGCTGFHLTRRTQVPHHEDLIISITRLSLSLVSLPKLFCYDKVWLLHRTSPCDPTTPLTGLGYYEFARRYSRNLNWFLFQGYLDGSVRPVWLLQPILFSRRSIRSSFVWVTPFGKPKITECLLLHRAYRSLLRPSSPYSS